MSIYLLEEYDKMHKRQGGGSPSRPVEVGRRRIPLASPFQIQFDPDELLQEVEPLILQCSATESE
jgi:hypothetical protein